MKELLLGNEAVARGLYEAGVRVVSSYPGTPSTEITEAAAAYDEIYCEWAPNEKVAAEVAAGASFGGARSFCGMKHVGLNVAADPLFTMSYIGVNGGMVLGVADDPGMHSSQNEQDSRNYAIAAKLPMVEPADSAECRDFTKLAYELSEQFDTPVLLRLSTRISHSRSIVELKERENLPLKPYEKNPAKNVMLPVFATKKHVAVEERTDALTAWAETSPINRIEDNGSEVGVIAAGSVYQYAREALGDTVSYLKLGMVNPLPEKLIRSFAAKVKKLYVIEELDPIIENFCRKIGVEVIGKDVFPRCGEYSQSVVRKCVLGTEPDVMKVDAPIPARPPVMCCGCPHRGVFYTLKKLGVYVSGDIGCYTLGATAPLSAMDTCVCMGASVSALHGYNKAIGADAEKKAVAVIGDSTFIHSGITGLKTGTTGKAGSCMAATAERDGMSLVAVVLGCASTEDRFSSAASLLDAGFSGWALTAPSLSSDALAPIAVEKGMQSTVAVEADPLTGVVVPKGREGEVVCEIKMEEILTAPVEQGQAVGEVTCVLDGEVLARSQIRAASSVEALTFSSAWLSLLRAVVSF